MINAGLTVDLPHIADTGAAGIGLFRTELQFMVAPNFPRTSEQYTLYRAVLDAAGDKPVTFRTLDIGGDKVLPYMRNVEEENPALGWRAIRLGLDRPGLLRTQIARAAARRRRPRAARSCFRWSPRSQEFDQAKELVERELTHLRRHGHKLPDEVEVGSMVEVPSLLYQLDELLERVDFLSVGSNDLVQFLYAVDRGNPRVAGRFDALSAPVLRALKDIADKGRAHNKPVTLCGELASQPIGALALVAHRLPLAVADAVGGRPGQGDAARPRCRKAAAFLCPLIEKPTGGVSIRAQLEEFAADERLADCSEGRMAGLARRPRLYCTSSSTTRPMMPDASRQKLNALRRPPCRARTRTRCGAAARDLCEAVARIRRARSGGRGGEGLSRRAARTRRARRA